MNLFHEIFHKFKEIYKDTDTDNAKEMETNSSMQELIFIGKKNNQTRFQ